MKRIGLLTSGGDCQGLNPTLRGVGKALYHFYGDDIQLYGFKNGYYGLMHNKYKELTPKDFLGILNIGGTILGTSRQPFKEMRIIGSDGFDKVLAMKTTYKKLGLDCLVVLGGNGSTKSANMLREEGLNVITLPKTIDNDVYGSDMTFGFQSAVDIATNVIDCIHTTADSHGRTFIVELMGHKAGWLTLYAGIGGGADAILIPEIPYSLKKICKFVKKRSEMGKHFTIIAVAEGAMSKEVAGLSKKERKKAIENIVKEHHGLSYKLGKEISEITGQEVRVTVPGHFQRGGAPCPYDRVLATRLGTYAARLIYENKYGYMVVLKNDKITCEPLEEVAGKLKTVPLDCDVIKSARDMGICFGD